MDTGLLSIVLGVVVVAVIGGLGLLLGRSTGEMAEKRLDEISGKVSREKAAASGTDLLKAPTLNLGRSPGWLAKLFSSEWLGRLYEQADVGFAFSRFLALCGGLALAGLACAAFFQLPMLMWPVCGALLGALPFLWLLLRRKKRLAQFIAQMPDALELVARALRAGHGLASGLHVVADEMPAPISYEFGRVFEEQNLGIPMEDALRGLADRVPTMDVRFFVTAVIIQRATGGDLAEILDKIGRLIRERFQILGQVQALTGEGRVSGAVLLAMPPLLLAFTYSMNPDYVGLLFNTEVGKQMLLITAGLQLVGAAAIKKIITIKV
jgi:tight adherence protein B